MSQFFEILIFSQDIWENTRYVVKSTSFPKELLHLEEYIDCHFLELSCLRMIKQNIYLLHELGSIKKSKYLFYVCSVLLF